MATFDTEGNILTAAVEPANYILGSGWVWAVSLVTLISTVLFSKYLKGFLGQLPLLLGAAVGCLFAAILYWVGGADYNLFRSLPPEVLEASAGKLGDGSIFALPAFSLPKVSWEAVAAIMPIAIATIPESTAHIYQLDIYVNDLAEKGRSNTVLPICFIRTSSVTHNDMISGVVGGPAEQTMKTSAQWRLPGILHLTHSGDYRYGDLLLTPSSR